jgi:hypothetical protein
MLIKIAAHWSLETLEGLRRYRPVRPDTIRTDDGKPRCFSEILEVFAEMIRSLEERLSSTD